MIKQISILIILVLGVCASVFAQKNKDDLTLFTVKNNPIKASEFEYIYNKTNGQNANYSKESLEEYLNLYVKFKLKVQKARDMKLDTIPSLMQELDGYRRQLADSYLIDKEVTDKLVKEAYERKKQDIDISHIMIAVKSDAPPTDTLAALNKIRQVQSELNAGQKFEALAQKYSDDGSSKGKGGRVGFITAVLPNGFYPFESAAYNTTKGEVSNIVRSGVGYHLVKVNDVRSARGEMEVAHILIRKEKDGSNRDRAMQKAMSIYEQIQKKGDFEEAARSSSDDKLTASKGGYLGTFGVNRYEDAFEDAAFALENDDEISKPVETKAGFHIIKRISKTGIQPFNEIKSRLEQKISQDARVELSKSSMVKRIKKENNFTQTLASLQGFKDTLNNDFLTFRWRAGEKRPQNILFNLGNNYRVTLGDFIEFTQKSARQRINLGRSGKNVKQVVDALYEEFVTSEVLKYEEKQLENKYPDFKSLMREYEEGILLFEATKMLVWDKASQDTTGLKEFFKTVDGKYKWEERAAITTYTVTATGVPQMEMIRKYAENHTPQEVLLKFNTDGQNILRAEEKLVEKGRDKQLDALDWKSGSFSDNEANKQTRSLMFTKIEEIVPPTNKTLKEARGYVVADYQDYLEKQWVEKLKKEYDVKVNKRVFNKLVKKG
ncbi:MAG: peptidylprolyl isomerase [Bacteroidota bacterium]